MLISELIELLQGYLAEHGDIPAVVTTGESEMVEPAGACLVGLVNGRIALLYSMRHSNETPKAVWLC